MRDLDFESIAVGDVAELEWQPSVEDIDAFAALSGDHNPLHMDDGYARGQGFAARVVHGLMVGAKVSALVGTLLPGRRCLLLDYALAHPNPVYAGDQVRFRAEVRERWSDFGLIELAVKAVKTVDGKDRTVARGTVKCKIRS